MNKPETAEEKRDNYLCPNLLMVFLVI